MLLYYSQLSSDSDSTSHRYYTQHRRTLSSSNIIRDKPSLDVQPEIPSQIPNRKHLRWGSYLTNISVILGLMALLVLLSDTSNAFSDWPEELREDLKLAVRAKNAKKYLRSESHFLRAYLTAKSMPLEELGPEPYLKLSAIAIALGEVFELQNNLKLALGTYVDVFQVLLDIESKTIESKYRDSLRKLSLIIDEPVNSEAIADSSSSDKAVTRAEDLQGQELSSGERLRLIALALHMNELVETVFPGLFVRDFFLQGVAPSSTVTMVYEEGPVQKSSGSIGQTSEFFLPSWARSPNLLAPLKAIVNAFWEQKDFASALKHNSIILRCLANRISKVSTPSCQLCEYAETLNHRANIVLDSDLHSVEANLDYAESCLSIAKDAVTLFLRIGGQDQGPSQCELILPMILINLGNVQERRGELEDAMSNFSNALSGAKALRQHEQELNASKALKRIALLREKLRKVESDVTTQGDI